MRTTAWNGFLHGKNKEAFQDRLRTNTRSAARPVALDQHIINQSSKVNDFHSEFRMHEKADLVLCCCAPSERGAGMYKTDAIARISE